MALFDNGNLEEFLLFVQNFQMTLEASGELTSSANIQYICTLLHGEALSKLDTLSVQIVIRTTAHLNRIILGLGAQFYSINVLSKQERAMHRRMRKPRKSKVRRYAACMSEINEYTTAFHGEKVSEKIGETELN